METPQHAEPSNGIGWAWVMVALIVVETLALTQVVVFDRPDAPWSTGSGLLGPYYLICLATLVLQVAGMVSVAKGFYRLGGVLQIVASSIHLVKIEGLIGIVGGVRAYRYSRSLPKTKVAPDSDRDRQA